MVQCLKVRRFPVGNFWGRGAGGDPMGALASFQLKSCIWFIGELANLNCP